MAHWHVSDMGMGGLECASSWVLIGNFQVWEELAY